MVLPALGSELLSRDCSLLQGDPGPLETLSLAIMGQNELGSCPWLAAACNQSLIQSLAGL